MAAPVRVPSSVSPVTIPVPANTPVAISAADESDSKVQALLTKRKRGPENAEQQSAKPKKKKLICAISDCGKRLNELSEITCAGCRKIFCGSHFPYALHGCPNRPARASGASTPRQSNYEQDGDGSAAF